MTYQILIADPLSEEGIYPLRQADGLDITVATELSKEDLLDRIDALPNKRINE